MKTNLRLIGCKKLQSPNNSYTRPTTLRVREAIFNILKNRVENSNWLDLFSGTGAISCEAYNHGASKILAIEKNKKYPILLTKESHTWVGASFYLQKIILYLGLKN